MFLVKDDKYLANKVAKSLGNLLVIMMSLSHSASLNSLLSENPVGGRNLISSGSHSSSELEEYYQNITFPLVQINVTKKPRAQNVNRPLTASKKLKLRNRYKSKESDCKGAKCLFLV